MTPQINLLPEVRQAKLKAKRHRRLAAGLATAVIGFSLITVVVLALVSQAQKLRISQLSREIETRQNEIKTTPNLEKMLTTQQHLSSLPGLYSQRVFMTKFYNLLSGVSPRDLAFESLEIDAQNVMSVKGRARNYNIASKFAKALEASNLTLGDKANPNNSAHFSEVTLGTVSAEDDGKVVFELKAKIATEVTSDAN
jgi:Tfp pilus assembly protein PilN